MLEITEEDGSTIPFDYTGDLDLAPLVKDAWDIEANDGKAFQFGRVNTKVLQFFRRHLNPGKTYHLRLCGQTLQIFCMYDEEYIDAILSGCEDPWGLSTENRVRPARDPQLITFTVIAGTRKPNFTISIKASSPFCSGLRPKMKISMCNTSLERRPATVKLDLDGFANVRPQDSLFRWRRQGSHDFFSLLNESRKEAGLLNMKFPSQRGFRESKEFDPHAQLIQFKYGTTCTKTLRIRTDKSNFVGGDKYSIKTGPQGFAAWDYGTRKELSKGHGTPSDRLKHSPIMFKPVSAVALTIEKHLRARVPKTIPSSPT